MNERIVATDDGLLFRCPFFDSGWCYADTSYEPNDTQVACNNPKECCVRQQMVLEYIRKANGGSNERINRKLTSQ